jgi:predicted nucleic acid-binding protein
VILLDTDILIDVFRNHPPALAWIDSVLALHPALPGYVVLELLAGCHNKSDVQFIQRRIQKFAVLWPDAAATNAILFVFANGHLSHALGTLDALIAATAISHNLTLHTFNTKHFAAVPGLKTIQPYTR